MRITIGNIKENIGITETYDIVNAIRNSSPNVANYVPLANAENVAEIGSAILINQTVQNEFITALVDRIGLVVIRKANLQNPLKKFKKGKMPLGRTIEEIFVDITKGKKYDAEGAEQTVFKRTVPNVKALFHERNRQDVYEQTIQDDSLASAFVSWGDFDSFLSQIINAIYNSAEVEEYEYMKLLIDNYYSKGLFKVVPITSPTNEQTTKDLVKKIRATVRKMSLPMGSRDYNSLAVRTVSQMSDLHVFIDADLEAQMDVDVLARAFNMSNTDFLGNVTVIDGFSSEGLEVVIVDKDWFMVYDNLLKLETIRNPKGLYWNYFYHVWQTLSVSRFSNAVAFVSGTVKEVTQVILNPTIATVKQGDTFQFETIIRQNDTIVYKPVYVVKSNGSGTKKAGTKIDASTGLLTVAVDETEELIVTSTVTFDTDKTAIGESIVTIQQK